jgi:hypothetical protein
MQSVNLQQDQYTPIGTETGVDTTQEIKKQVPNQQTDIEQTVHTI